MKSEPFALTEEGHRSPQHAEPPTPTPPLPSFSNQDERDTDLRDLSLYALLMGANVVLVFITSMGLVHALSRNTWPDTILNVAALIGMILWIRWLRGRTDRARSNLRHRLAAMRPPFTLGFVAGTDAGPLPSPPQTEGRIPQATGPADRELQAATVRSPEPAPSPARPDPDRAWFLVLLIVGLVVVIGFFAAGWGGF